jgi:PleD family two-component response regulator
MVREPSAPHTLNPPIIRRKILVVDDNREAADLIGDALRLSGHEVALAYRADEALLVKPVGLGELLDVIDA